MIRKMREAADKALVAMNTHEYGEASSQALHIRTVLDAYLIDKGVSESVARLARGE